MRKRVDGIMATAAPKILQSLKFSRFDIFRCFFVSVQSPSPDGTNRDRDCRQPRAQRLRKTFLQRVRGRENIRHGTLCCWNNKRADAALAPCVRKAELETHRTTPPLAKNL